MNMHSEPADVDNIMGSFAILRISFTSLIGVHYSFHLVYYTVITAKYRSYCSIN